MIYSDDAQFLVLSICISLFYVTVAQNHGNQGHKGDDLAESRERKVLNQEHDPEKLLRKEYKLTDEEWLEVRIQFDHDYDGELSESEGYKAAEYLEQERRLKQNKEEENEATKSATVSYMTYMLVGGGVILVVIIYAAYRDRQNSARGGFRLGGDEAFTSRNDIRSALNNQDVFKNTHVRKRNPEKQNTSEERVEVKHSTISKLVETPTERKVPEIYSDEKSDTPTKSKASLKTNELFKADLKNTAMTKATKLTEESKVTERNDAVKSVAKVSEEKRKVKSVSSHKKIQPASQEHSDIFESGTVEQQLIHVIKRVFMVDVVGPTDTKGTKTLDLPANTFKVKTGDLPASEQETAQKASILFERRAARDFLSKMKFCIQCHNHCVELQSDSKHVIVSQFVSHLRCCAVDSLLNQLKSDVGSSQVLDEDDFWSDLVGGTSVSHSQADSLMFLSRISGYTEDGIGISPCLLSEITTKAHGHTENQAVLINVIISATTELKRVPRKDELLMLHGKTIRGLELLLQEPSMVEIIAQRMEREIKESAGAFASYFERQSVLGSLFSFTTVPVSFLEGSNESATDSTPWTSLRGFPKKITRDELSRLEGQVQEGLKRLRNIVYLLLRKLLKSNHDAMLSWLASVITMNEMRLMQGQGDFRKSDMEGTCSHGFMLNLCAVLLELCMPFCAKSLDKLTQVHVGYAQSEECRLNYDFETCLAGGQIVSNEKDRGKNPEEEMKPSNCKFNLITEMLNITQRAMNVGFHPAFRHQQKMQQAVQQQMAMFKDSPQEDNWKVKQLIFTLKWDCSILEPDFMRNACSFYLATSHWLLNLLKDGQRENQSESAVHKMQKVMFSQIPEFIVKDMASWFTFIATYGLQVHPTILAGHAVDPSEFVECCVTLLERPDLLPGPIPATRISEALLNFLASSKRRSKSEFSFNRETSSELASMVHLCPSVQNQLGPALIRAFVSVDVVEGLDVDKDDFDKYSARHVMGKLIEELWVRQDCRTSMLTLAKTASFHNFLCSTLDTLTHQLHDSLDRIANVKKVQDAKDDEASWAALSFQEKDMKKRFLAGEEKAAHGFMKTAKSTLELINLLSQSEEVAYCFGVAQLAPRSASAFLGFLDSLCGPKAADLKVKDMDKYSFNPKELLKTIVDVMLRIAREDRQQEGGFVYSIAKDPDCDLDTMKKTLQVLKSKNLADDSFINQFQQLLDEISIMQAAVTGPTADKEVLPCHGWQKEIDEELIGLEELHKKYIDCLGPCKYDSIELEDSHSFQSNANQHGDPGRNVIQALHKEMRSWNKDLPVHPNAAIFIVQDENRMDLVRVLMTGPVDTPYSLGCFAFDVYFPPNYPNIPPVFKFITTGNGKRFNPNLYGDGKVCLSLLNTWHSTDESQKWNPSRSTLYQVLLSLQSLILVSDPLFNEPGYGSIQTTTEGEEQSRKYNAKIQLLTVRVAMLGQLRNPPIGLGNIVREHFRIQRHAVLKQCSQWLHQIPDKNQEKLLRRAVDDVRLELDKLQETDDSTEEEDDIETGGDVNDNVEQYDDSYE